MKKAGFVFLVFLLAFTQCKKEQVASDVSQHQTVDITLQISGGTSKAIVNPNVGSIVFENGDTIYVASNGTYVGTLTYDGSNFRGSITDPTEGQPLHFYYLGSQSLTLTVGTTTSCYVNICDQTTSYPVISYAPSRENYTIGTTVYSAELQNQCALVKFNVTTPSPAAICITGMNNQVRVDFSTNSFNYSQINNGVIRLAGGSGENVEKWAILFPQDALTEGSSGSAYSYDGCFSGTRPAIPAITKNAYLTDGINISVNTASLPTGAINGLFSVSANKQVYFSQGNLRYNPKSKLWEFAYPQYSKLHSGLTGDSNVSSEYTSTYTGWIDMFGWATSGISHGASCYLPYSTDNTDTYYHAYGNQAYNLYDKYGTADWGFNPISNGGDLQDLWRTPTSDEWSYVLNSRSTPSGIRFAKAKVDGVEGIILLPDHWDASIYTLSNTNNSSSNYSNTVSESDWTTLFEANGAVFLPAAGWRDQTNVIQSTYNFHGYYWSSSKPIVGNTSTAAQCLIFNTSSVNITSRSKHYGSSVRLIQDRIVE